MLLFWSEGKKTIQNSIPFSLWVVIEICNRRHLQVACRCGGPIKLTPPSLKSWTSLHCCLAVVVEDIWWDAHCQGDRRMRGQWWKVIFNQWLTPQEACQAEILWLHGYGQWCYQVRWGTGVTHWVRCQNTNKRHPLTWHLQYSPLTLTCLTIVCFPRIPKVALLFLCRIWKGCKHFLLLSTFDDAVGALSCLAPQ